MAFPIGWSLLANGLTTAQSGGTCTPWAENELSIETDSLEVNARTWERKRSRRLGANPLRSHVRRGGLGLWGFGALAKAQGADS